MRGLKKAAAWLLPALATTLVIPTDELSDAIFSSTLGANPTNPTEPAPNIIDYRTIALTWIFKYSWLYRT